MVRRAPSIPFLLGIVLALGGSVSASQGYPVETYDVPHYQYGYAVKDDYTGNYFTQKEKRDGYATKGEYSVQLPDGRLQIVRYIADEYGYRAEVSYEGSAYYPDEPYSKGAYSHAKPVYHAPAPKAYVPAKTNDEPKSYVPKAYVAPKAYAAPKVYADPKAYAAPKHSSYKSRPYAAHPNDYAEPSYYKPRAYSTPAYRRAAYRSRAYKRPDEKSYKAAATYAVPTYTPAYNAYSYLPSYAPHADYSHAGGYVGSYSSHQPTYIRPRASYKTNKKAYRKSYAPEHQSYHPRSYHLE